MVKIRCDDHKIIRQTITHLSINRNYFNNSVRTTGRNQDCSQQTRELEKKKKKPTSKLLQRLDKIQNVKKDGILQLNAIQFWCVCVAEVGGRRGWEQGQMKISFFLLLFLWQETGLASSREQMNHLRGPAQLIHEIFLLK